MDEEQKIKRVLERGVEEIIDEPHLVEKLKNGKKLRIKLGIDPTSAHIHLGRSIQLLKLRDFQELGHIIVLIVGDFTGTVGDTSDKESERPMLSEEVIKENLKTYIEQAGKIIDIDKAEIYFNSEWLSKLEYAEIGRQADMFSMGDFIARENISKRLNEGKRVSLREVLYPLMQGYDSVHVKADVEIGGTDQRFNLLAGRNMQRLYNQEPQDIIMSSLIEGLDGRKMSSSYGNTINIFDTPNDMFGKVMSLRDELIIKYFTLLTRCPEEIITEHAEALENGANPRDIKVALAKEIVSFFHNKEEADRAEEYFVSMFSKKEIPDDIKIVSVLPDSFFSDMAIATDMVSSKSEFKRKLDEKAVRFTEEVGEERIIEDLQERINTNGALRIGKKIIGLKISEN
jgi:tyrosyl-tRNA synthetase